MEEALTAYRIDPSYAISMAKQAATIAHKRAVWSTRLALRDAEKEATEQCAKAEPFVCETRQPCGTGTCRFAKGQMVLIDVPALPGKTPRPQVSTHSLTTTVEVAVRPLEALKAEPQVCDGEPDKFWIDTETLELHPSQVAQEALSLPSVMSFADVQALMPESQRAVMISAVESVLRGREVEYDAVYGPFFWKITMRRVGNQVVGRSRVLLPKRQELVSG